MLEYKVESLTHTRKKKKTYRPAFHFLIFLLHFNTDYHVFDETTATMLNLTERLEEESVMKNQELLLEAAECCK